MVCGYFLNWSSHPVLLFIVVLPCILISIGIGVVLIRLHPQTGPSLGIPW